MTDSTQPRALDLFCKAGGATKGLQRAGFHVTGVDIEPQPHYCGDAFVQADALTFPLDGYDFIWASPPCHAYSTLHARHVGMARKRLVAPIRRRLLTSGADWAIENVPGAPLCRPVMLCGAAFGLSAVCDDGRTRALRRHRLIETNFAALGTCCACQPGEKLGVYGSGERRPVRLFRTRPAHWHGSHGGFQGNARERADAMETPWMSMREAAQAVPPAYAEFIARQARAEIPPRRISAVLSDGRPPPVLPNPPFDATTSLAGRDRVKHA
jgi:DNA (cytosine-5)-methyltransferase 1